MTQQEMEAIWAEHIRHEFVTRDVEATLATMVEDASVNHVPVTTGGKGKTALRAASRPQVNHLMLDTVEGRRKRLRRSGLGWFSVLGVVAIQVEGQVKDSLDLEDRLMLVKANDPEDAQRRLQRMWSRYAEPYMNSAGYLVRWQLISVRDVYTLPDEAIDPRGTEVYSKLRRARMQPEYRWRPEKKARVARASK
jgi:hypothetical protein